MSGLYRVLFGVNECCGALLNGLGVDYKNVPRFRDCFLNVTGTEVIIYTRTGGGNRAEYAEANEAMTRIAGYLDNHDDSFDSTYALFRYEVPKDMREIAKTLAGQGYGVDPAKRWREALNNIDKHGK